MKTYNRQITTIRKFGNKELISFGKEFDNLRPGQFFLGYDPERDFHVRPVYFVSSQDENYFLRPEESSWSLGDTIIIKGPIGNGFSDLSIYQNLLLVSLGTNHGALTPLMETGLKSNKNVSVSVQYPEIQFSPSVEIVLPESLEESFDWADFIFVEINRDDLQNQHGLLKKIELSNIPCELLIYCPILCSGNAECMMCTVNTKIGKIKTCKQGQVFDLKTLELE
ncbi:MAG TPA: hypothetical protein VK856_05330 [Anaerolineaceae bacterium]|nr:hypothetical protein [Anaerolineaceae bacterium]